MYTEHKNQLQNVKSTAQTHQHLINENLNDASVLLSNDTKKDRREKKRKRNQLMMIVSRV